MSQIAVAEQLRVGEADFLPRGGERYAASLSSIYRLGEAGLSGAGVEAATALSYDDFTTNVAEMLKTDEEYGEGVDLARVKSFHRANGMVLAADGTPMVKVAQNGLTASSRSSDERLRDVQATRDEGDVLVAEAVDTLEVGQAVIYISLEPKAQLRGKDRQFWLDKGYRDGVAYIQWYCRTAEDEVQGAALSVSHSDLHTWQELLARRRVHVPPTADPNTFIRHGYFFDATGEQASETAQSIRREYYTSVGKAPEKTSVEELMGEHEQFLRVMFESYYPKIATALLTRHNDAMLQDFAHQALQNIPPEKLKPEIRAQLIRIANSSRFDEEMARTLDAIIPYAAKEHVRQGLAQPRHAVPSTVTSSQALPNERVSLSAMELAQISQQHMQMLALTGLKQGIVAGRAGGGCSGVNLAARSSGELELPGMPNQQDIFGGKAEVSNEPAGDKDGPYVFLCEKCHYENDRRKEPGKWVMKCQGCKTDVSCGRGGHDSTPKKAQKSPPQKIVLFKNPKKGTHKKSKIAAYE